MKTLNYIYRNKSSLTDFINENQLKDIWDNFIIQIFSGDIDKNKITSITNEIKEIIPNAKIVWCTTSWEIMNWSIFESEVVISFSVFDKTKIKTFFIKWEDMNEDEIGDVLVNKYISSNDKVLFLYTDWLKTMSEKILQKIQERYPYLILTWAKAWDNKNFSETYIFNQSEITSYWLVWFLLSWDSLIVNNDYIFGWATIWKYMKITKAEKNKIYEIDWQPVIDIYSKYLGEEIAAKLPSSGNQFPLILERDGIKIARDIISIMSDNSIVVAGDVRVWDEVRFGCGDKNKIWQRDFKLVNRFKEHPIESVFIYSCYARKNFLWDDISRETNMWKDFPSSVGFFTYWEYFHTMENSNQLLNETMSVLTLSESKDSINKNIKLSPDVKSMTKEDLAFYAVLHLSKETNNELYKINKWLEEILSEKIEEIEKTKFENLKAYEKFIEDMSEWVVITDENKKIIYFNKQFRKLVWYESNELNGGNFFGIIDAQTIEYLKNSKYNENKIEDGVYFTNLYAKDQEKIPVNIIWKSFLNESRIAIIKDLREVEELRIKNKQLEQSETRYRAVVEDQTELICRYSNDGTITFVNQMFCSYFGGQCVSKIWKNFFDLTTKFGIDNLYDMSKSLTLKNPVKTINSTWIFENETSHWFEWTIRAIFDKKHKLIEYQAVWRDISEMIYMEEKVKQTKNEYFEMYKTIIDNMSEIVWIGDNRKRTIYANPKYLELTWYTLEEIRGKDVYDLWSDETKNNVKNSNRNVSFDKMYKWEWIIVTKEWEIIPVLMDKKPFVDGGMVIIMTDLREIKRIQERANQLEQMNKIKDEFISVASHELRTPMTSIKWYISMLLEGDFWEINDEIRNILSLVHKSTARQIDLINDMLDIAKLESWNVVLNYENFILKEIVDEITNEYKNIAKTNWIDLWFENNLEDLKVKADKNKLRQVIINLVWNALKFTPKWWRVLIKTSLKNKEYALVEVIDTWVGIEEKDFDKVFWKFQQVQNSLNRNHSGTWLGVPISKNLIEKMWWELKLKSEIWKWSDFYFTIPLAID